MISDANLVGVAEAVEESGSEAPSGPKILLAEDMDTNMLLVKRMIKQILPKARIIEASDGKEAVERWQSARPALVLMDIQMPVMDGAQATEAIRKQEKAEGKNQHTPIIALTARTLKDEKAHFLQSGLDDVVDKPLNKDLLTQKLHQYLSDTYH